MSKRSTVDAQENESKKSKVKNERKSKACRFELDDYSKEEEKSIFQTANDISKHEIKYMIINKDTNKITGLAQYYERRYNYYLNSLPGLNRAETVQRKNIESDRRKLLKGEYHEFGEKPDDWQDELINVPKNQIAPNQIIIDGMTYYRKGNRIERESVRYSCDGLTGGTQRCTAQVVLPRNTSRIINGVEIMVCEDIKTVSAKNEHHENCKSIERKIRRVKDSSERVALKNLPLSVFIDRSYKVARREGGEYAEKLGVVDGLVDARKEELEMASGDERRDILMVSTIVKLCKKIDHDSSPSCLMSRIYTLSHLLKDVIGGTID